METTADWGALTDADSCYSTANRINAALQKRGLSTRFVDSELLVGDIMQWTERFIDDCAVVAVLVTRRYVKAVCSNLIAHPCLLEWSYASARKPRELLMAVPLDSDAREAAAAAGLNTVLGAAPVPALGDASGEEGFERAADAIYREVVRLVHAHAAERLAANALPHPLGAVVGGRRLPPADSTRPDHNERLSATAPSASAHPPTAYRLPRRPACRCPSPTRPPPPALRRR